MCENVIATKRSRISALSIVLTSVFLELHRIGLDLRSPSISGWFPLDLEEVGMYSPLNHWTGRRGRPTR